MCVGGDTEVERQRDRQRQTNTHRDKRDAETGASLICDHDSSLPDYNVILRTPVNLNYYLKRPPSNIVIVGL